MGAVQFIENLDRTTLTITDGDFEKNVEAAVSAIAEKHAAASPALLQQQPYSYNEKGTSPRPSLDDQMNLGRMSMGAEPEQESQAISGLLKTIQRPLSSIGRMFSDEGGPSSLSTIPAADPLPPPPMRPRPSERQPQPAVPPPQTPPALVRSHSRHSLSAEEAAARQASAETAEVQKLQRAEHANVVETLAGMFPDLDRDIISDVVHQKQGR